jgi:TRAP-type C4-dicarboxylate transport system, small permease component
VTKFIIKFSRLVTSVAVNTSALLIALIALLVFFQVVTRFVFDSPSTWSEITARMMMVWMVFISMGCVFSRGSMITINFFADILPGRLNTWALRIVTALVVGFLLILIWYGWEIAIRVKSQNVAMLNISAFWMYVSIPIGAILALPSVLEWHLVNVEQSEPETPSVTATPTAEV